MSGEGTYGEADDKVVTNAGFIIIIAVPLFMLAMSLLQGALERRKERRKAAGEEAQRRRLRLADGLVAGRTPRRCRWSTRFATSAPALPPS